MWCVVSEGDVFILGGFCSSGGDSSDCSFSSATVTEVTADIVVDVVVIVFTKGGSSGGDSSDCSFSSAAVTEVDTDVVVDVVFTKGG